MVILNRIYTRTGDDGTTALGQGERRLKYDLRIEAFGTVDETNACIGLARCAVQEQLFQYSEQGPMPTQSFLQNMGFVDHLLEIIQNDLFDLGADLCVPPQKGKTDSKLRINFQQVERLEQAMDRLNASLSVLQSFVMPGGSKASAALHLARTVCRRAERLMVALKHQSTEEKERIAEPVGKPALCYINRLSDFLFIAARIMNEGGTKDVLWVPGKHTTKT